MTDLHPTDSRAIAIEQHELDCIVKELEPRDLTRAAREILRAVAETVVTGGRAGDVAGRLGMHPRTLSRATRRAFLPPALDLMRWFRVALAARELERPGVTLEQAAAACGYASRTVIAQAIRDLTGMAPAELARRGAFATASSLFRLYLTNARAERRRRA